MCVCVRVCVCMFTLLQFLTGGFGLTSAPRASHRPAAHHGAVRSCVPIFSPTHPHTRIHAHARTHACVCAHTHTNTPAHACACARARSQASHRAQKTTRVPVQHAGVDKFSHTHARARARAHTHTHTHTLTLTHSLTHRRRQVFEIMHITAPLRCLAKARMDSKFSQLYVSCVFDVLSPLVSCTCEVCMYVSHTHTHTHTHTHMYIFTYVYMYMSMYVCIISISNYLSIYMKMCINMWPLSGL